MKNGFTLIELLGVIIIISLLALITSVAVTKLVKDSKQQLSNVQKGLIVEAAKIWGADNLGKLPGNGECVYLSVSDLENEGLLDNSENLDDNIIIRIKNKLNENGKEKLEYKINGATAGCSNGVKNLYKDESKANIPSLRGLVPVVYDEEKSSWKIIDPTEEWYDYDNQWWANAVILREDLREEKNIGDLISVPTENNDFASSDVLAMFVWIPRYSYTIGNTYGVMLNGGSEPSQSTPGAIDIKFVGVDSIKENGLAAYEGDTPSGWYTHPAFTFGDEELSGIWVGKFETSHETFYNSTQSNNLSCTNESCEEADNLRILPNVQSLRRNNVSNFFFASRSMSRDGNPFGINSSLTDTHMMKNSEWGAVAYLSQSKYGKYGNDDYTGVNKEVYQNKSNSYMTGSSNGTPSQEETIKQYSYNDISSEVEGIGQCGPGASTTGNITGVYDMNGGASEYVMGYYTQAVSGTTYPWGSSGTGISAGFENKIDDKYFDTYIDSNYSEKTCNNGICYGHALSETKEWYNNGFRLIYGAAPWMTRGLITKTNDSKGEGMFNLDMYQGINLSTISFRIILAPIS